MGDISLKEMNGVAELFASDHSLMRNVHIERAKQNYVKLKELGYLSSPNELRIDKYLWVDVFSYLKPRTKFIAVGDKMEIRVLQHPGGLWTYGVLFFVAQEDGHSCQISLPNYFRRSMRRMTPP